MKKVVTIILVVFMFLLMLGACKGKEAGNPTPEVTKPEVKEEQKEESKEEEKTTVKEESEEEVDDTLRTTGFFEGGYISFTAENGWYIEEAAGDPGDYIYFIQSENNPGRIQMEYRTYNTLSELVESTAKTWEVENVEEITIKGIRYKLLTVDDEACFLFTSCGKFDEEKDDSVLIKVLYISLEDAMPFLETIETYEVE